MKKNINVVWKTLLKIGKFRELFILIRENGDLPSPIIWGRRSFAQNLLFSTKNIAGLQEIFKILITFKKYCMFFNLSLFSPPYSFEGGEFGGKN